MTPEHDESEELYQQLRRKLDGYGSDPSEAVWAAIQQQLPPPPVPPPAGPAPPAASPTGLRYARYSWPWTGVAAVLSVGVLLTALWLVWPKLRQHRAAQETAAPRTETTAPDATPTRRAATAPSTERANGRAADRAEAPLTASLSTTPELATPSAEPAGPPAALRPTETPAPDRARPEPLAGQRRAGQVAVVVSPEPAPRRQPTAPATANARPAGEAGLVASAGATDPAPKRRSLARAVPAGAGTEPSGTQTATPAAGREVAPRPADSAASVARAGSIPAGVSPVVTRPSTAEAGANSAGAPAARRRAALPVAGAAASETGPPPTAAELARVRAELARTRKELARTRTQLARVRAEKTAAAGLVARNSERSRVSLGSPDGGTGTTRRRAQVADTQAGEAAAPSNEPRAARQLGSPVSLGLVPLVLRPAPLVSASGASASSLPSFVPADPATARRTPPARRPGRWSVQALAGPTITHRRLGLGLERSSVQLQDLERPAVAFAGQLLAGYALSGRTQLRLGAGYTVYAQRLNFTVRQRSPLLDTATIVRNVSNRDVRQYLTVPLGLRYELGHRSRLRYAAVASVAARLTLGGWITQGNPCACQQSGYDGGDPSFLLLENLEVASGLELRYQLAPRWQWLAQPTFTYSIFSSTNVGTDFRPRYLWSAGILTGVSYNFR